MPAQKSRCSQTPRSFVVAVMLMGSLLVGCGGASDPPATEPELAQIDTIRATKAIGTSTETAGPSSIAVVALTRVSETRISRTVFEYAFQLTVANAGGARSGVTVTLISVGPGTSIVDGSVVVGDIAAAASVTPADLLVVRHDRTQPFNTNSLAWQVAASSAPVVTGILLQGSPQSPAVDALQDYSAPRTAAELQTTTDSRLGVRFYARQINAVLTEGATILEVNSALTAIGGRIVWSRSKNRAVTIQVAAPPGNALDSLNQAIATLNASPAFASASISILPRPSALPSNVQPSISATLESPILGPVATGFPAAWNARLAQARREVELIVIDYFGQGAIQTSLLASTPTGTYAEISCPSPPNDGICVHGYHVLGLAAGSYGGSTGGPGLVTGTMPTSVPTISIIDLNAAGNKQVTEYIREQLEARFKARPNAYFVLNYSLGYGCDETLTPAQCKQSLAVNGPTWALNDALSWRTWAQGLGPAFKWDDRVVQVSAAGNESKNDARVASEYNAAALLPAITVKGSAAPLLPFKNALVVEARTVDLSGPVPKAGCLADFSNVNGTIGAIGTAPAVPTAPDFPGLYSFTGPGSVGRLQGTSMASPQVAGLVAWMISLLEPAFPLSDVTDRVLTSRFVEDNCIGARPVIDAYAALLSLDRDLANAPVRTAILRAAVTAPITSNEKPGFTDAVQFLRAFFPTAYGLPAADVSLPAFSRFDLNGDGYVGDTRTGRFDLTLAQQASPFMPGVVKTFPNSLVLATPLNEAQLSDFQIFCHYINSPLFNESHLSQVNQELADISTKLQPPRRVSCAEPAVKLEVNTTAPGWFGLPASIAMPRAGFVATNPISFSINGSPQNTCGFGERGGPVFSGSVPLDALFWGTSLVEGMPFSGPPTINRRPCSSFFARKTYPDPMKGAQVWINATGRGQQFSGSNVSDWEYQVRYTNGDEFGLFKRCEVGVVPNSGAFIKNFDAACSHVEDAYVIRQ
jgi:hypothetical protein